ncbi:radical SAM family heme chaperone HemW [Pedobacter sp.]
MAGIYIHIPFCKKACTYCDFHFTTSTKYMAEMVDAICKEIILKQHRLAGQKIGSIYFGGGTPSVLPTTALQQIFSTLEKHFSIASNAEITIETNPDDLTAKKIADFRTLPVNRFSIGTQSFFDDDLLWMNRAHNANEAVDSIKRSQDAGFENLTIDLIYGYPLLNDEKWKSNINTAVELQIPHLSAYSLTVEPRTALANAIEKGKQKRIDDEQSAAQFLMLIDHLSTKGFEHYEISNYSLPGHHAVHNTNYWKGVPYLGIGPSAHGFDGDNRFINIANNAKYMESLFAGSLPEEVEFLTPEDRFNEYIMTSLRTMWGINLQEITSKFGSNFADQTKKQIEPFMAKGQLIHDNGSIKLTHTGKLFADGIAAALFAEDDY